MARATKTRSSGTTGCRAARKPGYQGFNDDYRAVLENRRPDESLADAMRPLTVLMDGLALMGKLESAREIYVFIRQGLEDGTLAGSEQELIGRYLESILLTSPEEARKSLAETLDHRPQTVSEQDDRVAIGGVVVPKRR